VKILLASLLLIGLRGCPTAQPPAPVVANTVSTASSSWQLLYGSGTPSRPSPLATAWAFDFPAALGSVHYVTTPMAQPIGAGTLTATFRIVSAGATYSAAVEPVEDGPASLHLFIQREGDDFINEYNRWWCADDEYLLGSNDNQIVTLTCPLVYTAWTDVYGHQDATQFAATLANIGNIGFTFGGSGNGWGHGVRLASGTARFELQSYELK
jgi:hypothetical protein